MDEMVIFTRTRELLHWLLPRCERFPKAQRFVVTKRLQDAALDFQETIFLANVYSGRKRLEALNQADAHLQMVRFYLQMVFEWHWLDGGQYAHVSKIVAEVGRLLGGWIRQSQGKG